MAHPQGRSAGSPRGPVRWPRPACRWSVVSISEVTWRLTRRSAGLLKPPAAPRGARTPPTRSSGWALLCSMRRGVSSSGPTSKTPPTRSGICAERTALQLWRSEGGGPIQAVVIYTDTDVPTPPCGLCREALRRWAGGAQALSGVSGRSGGPVTAGGVASRRGQLRGWKLNAKSIIRRKRDGAKLEEAEIRFLVQGAVSGAVSEYQLTAWMMAVFFRGMDPAETAALTQAMLESGDRLDFGSSGTPPADKHSTGGVGDKISFLVAPLVASVGVPVPMVSGRSLGHTGGTLDKLESIPGLRTGFEPEEIRGLVERIGFCFAGQSKRIAPADAILYALRDAASIVESIPLITASILSKKAAAGVRSLALDVKVGDGAFMPDATARASPGPVAGRDRRAAWHPRLRPPHRDGPRTGVHGRQRSGDRRVGPLPAQRVGAGGPAGTDTRRSVPPCASSPAAWPTGRRGRACCSGRGRPGTGTTASGKWWRHRAETRGRWSGLGCFRLRSAVWRSPHPGPACFAACGPVPRESGSPRPAAGGCARMTGSTRGSGSRSWPNPAAAWDEVRPSCSCIWATSRCRRTRAFVPGVDRAGRRCFAGRRGQPAGDGTDRERLSLSAGLRPAGALCALRGPSVPATPRAPAPRPPREPPQRESASSPRASCSTPPVPGPARMRR